MSESGVASFPQAETFLLFRQKVRVSAQHSSWTTTCISMLRFIRLVPSIDLSPTGCCGDTAEIPPAIASLSAQAKHDPSVAKPPVNLSRTASQCSSRSQPNSDSKTCSLGLLWMLQLPRRVQVDALSPSARDNYTGLTPPPLITVQQLHVPRLWTQDEAHLARASRFWQA